MKEISFEPPFEVGEYMDEKYMKFSYCANPLRCCREKRVYGAIRWRKTSNISYYSDEKLESMLYTPNSIYSLSW